jgi:hypothetical protein
MDNVTIQKTCAYRAPRRGCAIVSTLCTCRNQCPAVKHERSELYEVNPCNPCSKKIVFHLTVLFYGRSKDTPAKSKPITLIANTQTNNPNRERTNQ